MTNNKALMPELLIPPAAARNRRFGVANVSCGVSIWNAKGFAHQRRYVLNNPLKYTDASGEFFVAALIGALISVVANGIINTIEGRPFFEGAGMAAITGAIGGMFANMIGMATSTLSGIMKIGIQAVAHGHLGGMMSGMMGGDYGSGFLSGFAGSVVASGARGILKTASNFWKGAGTVVAGSLSGGAGSVIAGGKFWDGFRNGAISSSLNHVVHMIQQTRSIKGSDGKELNPDRYKLSNRKLKSSIIELYDKLSNEYGNSLEFKITGGDRYNVNGKNYSSTNDGLISKGGPTAHNVEKGARAVDLRIRINSNHVNYKIIQPYAQSSNLIYDYNALPQHYPNDLHHHLQLVNHKKNWANYQ